MFRTHDRLRAATAAALALSLAWAPVAPALAAEAEVERTVAFVELRQGTEANSLSLDYLREAAKSLTDTASGDFIVVPAEKSVEKVGANRQQVPSALTDERRASLDEARKKGIEYLDKADAANAIKALRAAEAKYRAAIAAPGADEALRRAYLDVLAQLATAHKVANDDESAREVFRAVVTTFGPSAPITDNDYRPDVVAIFQSIVAEMKKLPQGSIEAVSTPSGCKVLVGGIDRGETPTEVKSLMPGLYSVRAIRGNATSLLHRIRVDAGKATKVSFDLPFESHLILEDNNVGLSYRDLEEAKGRISADALVIGKSMDVNLVVVVGIIERKLTAFVVDVASGKVTVAPATSVPQIGVSKRAVTRVVQAITGKGDAGPAVVEEEGPNIPAIASLAGGGVLTVVGLALLGANGAFSGDDFVVTTQEEANSAQTQRTLGGVMMGLGLAAAGVGVFLLLRKGGEETAILRGRDGMPLLPPVELGRTRAVFASAQ